MEHKIAILQQFVRDLLEEERIFKHYFPPVEEQTDIDGAVISYSEHRAIDIGWVKVAITKLQQQLRAANNKKKALTILAKKKGQRRAEENRKKALAILTKKREQ